MLNEKATKFLKIEKPIIGMIHLKGENYEDKLKRAISESDILFDNGVNAILVENYFGSPNDVCRVLQYFSSYMNDRHYGVNLLGNYEGTFKLAAAYNASFIQIDSVSGHLRQKDDEQYGAHLKLLRENSGALVLGGVRFKYKPILSGRSLEEDITTGLERCDIIVTTGEGTGMETDINKLIEFKNLLGSEKLIVGAGVTYSNCKEQLLVADGAIIGSYFKVGHDANNEIKPDYVKEIMGEVKILRKK